MELPRPLTELESDILSRFAKTAENRAKIHGVEKQWNIVSIAEEAAINLFSFPKEGVLIQAIWIAFLSAMRLTTTPRFLKFSTVKDFQLDYAPYFDNYPQNDLNILWQNANWMATLFTLIPSKKNKGLAIAIIPKLVEGWNVKYVTGSGQTKATADRVKIFETEGNTQPSHRGKQKPRKIAHTTKSPLSKPKRHSQQSRKRNEHRLPVPASTPSASTAPSASSPQQQHMEDSALAASCRPERSRRAPPGSSIYLYDTGAGGANLSLLPGMEDLTDSNITPNTSNNTNTYNTNGANTSCLKRRRLELESADNCLTDMEEGDDESADELFPISPPHTVYPQFAHFAHHPVHTTASPSLVPLAVAPVPTTTLTSTSTFGGVGVVGAAGVGTAARSGSCLMSEGDTADDEVDEDPDFVEVLQLLRNSSTSSGLGSTNTPFTPFTPYSPGLLRSMSAGSFGSFIDSDPTVNTLELVAVPGFTTSTNNMNVNMNMNANMTTPVSPRYNMSFTSSSPRSWMQRNNDAYNNAYNQSVNVKSRFSSLDEASRTFL